MFEDIIRLAKQSLAYGLGNILISGAGIILIPVYTRFLTVADYGIIGSLAPLSTLLMYFYNLGMSGAIMRFDSGFSDEEVRRNAHGSACTFLIMMAVVTTILLAGMGVFCWDFVFPAIPYFPFALLVLGTVTLDTTNVVPMALLRIRGRAIFFSAIQFLRFLVMTTLIILFVVVWRLGAKGQLAAVFLSSCFFSVLYVAISSRFIKVGLNFAHLKKYLAFGLPIIPSGLALWALTMSNLFILQRLTSLEQVGLFSLGAKFGQVLDILSVAIITAWGPFFFNKANTETGPELFSQVATYFVFLFLGIGAAVLVGAHPLLHIATTPKFYAAGRVVSCVVAASVFKSMYLFNVQGISFKLKTKYLPIIDGFAAVLCVGFNLLLIPKWGMMGAAVSAVIAYGVQFLSAFLVSVKLYPIPYQYKRLLKILIVYSAAVWILSHVSFASDMVTLILRLGLLPVLVVIGLVLLRIPEKREVDKLLEFYRGLKLPKTALPNEGP